VSPPWQVRRLAVCASTERQLERWLLRDPPPEEDRGWRRMVVARRQRFGRGQQGRVWQSPAGGLWLSAAFPWPADASRAAAPALAMALGVAQELEALTLAAAPLPLAIKWPNDLYVGGRKLAGLLPRLRLRGGRVRWAQLGLGLNGINRAPVGAIALGQALQQPVGQRRLNSRLARFDPRATPRALEALAQRAIERTLALAPHPERVRLEVEQRLWRPPEGIERDGVCWQIAGLERDGGLRVVDPTGGSAVWRRDF